MFIVIADECIYESQEEGLLEQALHDLTIDLDLGTQCLHNA